MWGRFRQTKKAYVAILLVVITVASVLVYVYYSMSVASVSTLTIDEVLADRKFVSGTYPNRNATFIIEVRVWSKAQSLGVRLDNPLFLVSLSALARGNQTLPGGTMPAGAYLTYNVRFNINESRDIGTVSFPNASVLVQMTARATAGLYSQTVTVRDSAAWDWTTATLIWDYH